MGQYVLELLLASSKMAPPGPKGNKDLENPASTHLPRDARESISRMTRYNT